MNNKKPDPNLFFTKTGVAGHARCDHLSETGCHNYLTRAIFLSIAPILDNHVNVVP